MKKKWPKYNFFKRYMLLWNTKVIEYYVDDTLKERKGTINLAPYSAGCVMTSSTVKSAKLPFGFVYAIIHLCVSMHVLRMCCVFIHCALFFLLFFCFLSLFGISQLKKKNQKHASCYKTKQCLYECYNEWTKKKLKNKIK